MKKSLFLTLMAITCCLGFTACGDDDDSGSLSGWYSTPQEWVTLPTNDPGYYYRAKAYNFTGKNTVVVYNSLSTDSGFGQAIPGHSGWYGSVGRYYTYVVNDNKLVIENGEIWTLRDGGKSLYRDSYVMSKWK